ncbi:Asp-tRNA(Asn)/Glu-tRNA(Gln) amidotransferase subunit GatC [Terrihabitans rhizophilus]|uniref:Aspartyl/glutamyl-tRNA(Asn/Gln) amidotransferase subunit C n=1 Tax=Terrihabitans rhizophilus TaxID=3092662 RepID=A0ABU4RQY1_9HYPH|nr:Asp-tRNA(Asn)/Glu-tRNA(Gln) amidotransferase subunit GatC [Terrihabitans sp. PJ23]MDX6805186.1 Asp-tRNA(Asn)/Glu-tRNA(Gln) amidotransferase subunit GatC [Terrihabitans sp. PJ23]
MAVDEALVRRVAKLARIAVTDSEVPHLAGELNAILNFVEELSEVDVEGIEPMTSVTPMKIPMREDKVTAGGEPERVLANAPVREGNFFVVPKVVE